MRRNGRRKGCAGKGGDAPVKHVAEEGDHHPFELLLAPLPVHPGPNAVPAPAHAHAHMHTHKHTYKHKHKHKHARASCQHRVGTASAPAHGVGVVWRSTGMSS